MKADFKTWILVLIFVLPVFLLAFIVILYVGNCGFRTDCSKVGLPEVIHTPIPTLIPATLPVPEMGSPTGGGSRCSVTARSLLAAWVSSGYSETERFEFTDMNDATCEATYADVKPLFTEVNLWDAGALACASCHHADLATASAQMDLSSYAGMLAGSRRSSLEVKGNDILGGGDWDKSLLNQMLFVEKKMPLGHQEGAAAEEGPTIWAGMQKPTK
jgi:cytochrome c553